MLFHQKLATLYSTVQILFNIIFFEKDPLQNMNIIIQTFFKILENGSWHFIDKSFN
jgi:hypothetical protein